MNPQVLVSMLQFTKEHLPILGPRLDPILNVYLPIILGGTGKQMDGVKVPLAAV